MACGGCSKDDSAKCVFNDDTVNIALEKAKEADGFIEPRIGTNFIR